MNWLLVAVGAALILLVAGIGYLTYRHRDRLGPVVARQKSTGGNVAAVLLSFRAKVFYSAVVVFAIAIGIVWFSWTYAGPIATIVYVVLFLVFATLFPVAILLFGSALPGSGMVGKLHGVLGAFAFGGLALVQFDDKWELCPAREQAVYVGGEWYEVPDGQDNLSVLWWNRFGMLRFKDDDTLESVRADTVAERGRGTSADGGTIERGDYTQASPPGVSGQDGMWLLDLKRLVGHGIKKIGNIELIETAEEITSREQAKEGLTAGWEPILGSIVGLIIGIATGWLLLGGV